jgi:3-methyladenine DNA glycosylase AlkD
MTPQTLSKRIRTFCEDNYNCKLVEKYQRYFKEGYDAFGISQDLFTRQKEEWLILYKSELGMNGFIELGRKLINTGKYEEASFAITFMGAFQDNFSKDTFQELGFWLENGICNWAHTDILSGLLAHFFTEEIVTLQAMSEWRYSESKWRRRAVPVTMLSLLKTEKNLNPLFDFINALMMDPERVVHQGLGWFLREAWKKQPAQTEKFLKKWKDKAPRLIFQYATEKMDKETRERFRREK